MAVLVPSMQACQHQFTTEQIVERLTCPSGHEPSWFEQDSDVTTTAQPPPVKNYYQNYTSWFNDYAIYFCKIGLYI